MDHLIGLDDTDSAESRGTGFRARQLALLLEDTGLARVRGISRHQLLVSPRIPYTSHNSSACLLAEVAASGLEAMIEACRRYLLAESAPGADVGVCVAEWGQADGVVQGFGARAKQTVLVADEAARICGGRGILLEGLTGTGGGVIGALAAVGLRRAGNDGRLLWLRGLREVEGVHRVADLLRDTGIESIEVQSGGPVPPADTVDVGEWTRPVLRSGRAVLLVEEARDHERSHWRVLGKDAVKRLSD